MLIRSIEMDEGLVVTGRVQIFLSACVVAALIGFGSSAVRAEPLKYADPQKTAHAFDRMPAKHSFAAMVAPRAKGSERQIETAMRSLDLSKLTLADFGDVDPEH